MPALANSKHELFAQEVVKGISALQAYKLAGYTVKSNDVAQAAGSRLLSHVIVAARIAELKEAVAEKTVAGVVASREDVLAELRKIAFVEFGHEYVKASDKRASLVDIAKIEGWVIEKSEVRTGQLSALDEMSRDELSRLDAEISASLEDGNSGRGSKAPTSKPH